MAAPVVTAAVEGQTDVPVVRRLLADSGFELGPVYVTRGKHRLDAQIKGYNRAAARSPWFVLRDLNGDEPCAGALVRRLLPAPAHHMRLRIAMRSMESWLLADRERIAMYLAVSPSKIPAIPDELTDPKGEIVTIARGSRSRAVRDDFVPIPGTRAAVGPGYTTRIGEYASIRWRPEIAAQSSPSLARCLTALRSWRALGAEKE